MYSEDPEALDWAEAVIEQLLADAPAEPEWIICRLHSADAAEAAAMLNYLFPDASVPKTSPATNTGGGLFSLFGGSRNAATDPSTLGGDLSKAGSLKVITDAATNSLYISGPEEIMPKVKMWLRRLDSDVSRKRPRSIDVKYADVHEIAEAVKIAFPEEIGADAGQQQQQGGNRGGGRGFGGPFNPIGMMLGGGNQQQPQQRVQLSVYPDAFTNKLMVRASDRLFHEVEEVVHSLDLPRTVQWVPLKNVNSTILAQTLSSLSSKVQTSASQGAKGVGNRNGANAGTDVGGSQNDMGGQSGQQPGGFNPMSGQGGGRGMGTGQGSGGRGQGGGGMGAGGMGGQGFGGRGSGGGRGGN